MVSGPDPLGHGHGGQAEANGLVHSPKAAARLESSKVYAKEFMKSMEFLQLNIMP